MKCITCGRKVEIKSEDGKEHYVCPEGHKNPRMILNEGLEHYKEEGETIHVSVGAIIIKDGKVLLLERRKYPFKHTIPAGHLEEDENPEKAVIREIKEETGMDVSNPQLEVEEKIKDPCRRGADYHYWHLYSIKLNQECSVELNDEASSFRWEGLSEIKNISLTDPTEYFLSNEKVHELQENV